MNEQADLTQSWYKQEADVLTVMVYVQPGASRNEVVGLHNGSLKIKLTSPPLDGRANKMLLKYLSKLFCVSVCQLTLIKGQKSRHKMVSIVGSSVLPVSLLD